MANIVDDEGAAQPPSGEPPVAPLRALEVIEPGSTTGIGSLPHRTASQAVEFAFDAYDVPAIPSLPKRSPAESFIAQALVGTAGVTLGQYGTVAVDVDRLDPAAAVDTDLSRDNFVGFRTFLDAAAERGYEGPVKWQFVGPISVGVALRRAGALARGCLCDVDQGGHRPPAGAFAWLSPRHCRDHLNLLFWTNRSPTA